MKKRFLSIFLAAIMIISLLPAAAFADGSYLVANNVSAQVQGDHGTAKAEVSSAEVTEATKDASVVFTAMANEGYKFDHWEVVSGGVNIEATKTNNPITVTMPGEALTLKAYYAPITYTVNFDACGGYGITPSQTMTYDVAAKLNPNEFEAPTERQFAGWSKSNTDDTPVYGDCQKVRNLANTQDAEVTLYAVWKYSGSFVATYLIDDEYYDGGDLSNTFDAWDPRFPDEGPKGSTATANEGYFFKGWKDAEGHFITQSDMFYFDLCDDGKTIKPIRIPYKERLYYTAVFRPLVTVSGVSMNKTDFAYGDAVGYTGTPVAKTIEDVNVASSIESWTYTYFQNNGTAEVPNWVYLKSTPADLGSYKLVVEANDIENDYQGKLELPFTIGKRAVTVSGIAVQDKTYNGKTDDAVIILDNVSFTGKLDADNLTISGITGTYASANASDTQTVNLNASSAWTLGGESAANYMLATEGQPTSVTGKINKVTPYIKTAPEPTDIIYGKTLNDSTLSGGFAQVSSSDTTEIGGQFTWTNGDTVPAVADSETTLYSVTFTPAVEDNFNSVTCSVKLTVTQADYADVTKTVSGSLRAITGSTVEITLPAIPEGAAYGTATKTNAEDKYTLSSISGGKITATSTGIDAGTGSMTFTVPVTPDNNHKGYNITVTITPTFKDVVTITADTEDFTYGDSGKIGYKNITVQDNLVDVNTLAATYYLSDGTTKTNTENSGADSEGAVPANAGSYNVVLSVPESNNAYAGSAAVPFTIAKKAVTVTANSKTLYVGDSFENGAENIGAVITGLLNEDSVSEYELGVEVPFDEAFKLTTAGTYPVVVTVAEDAAGANYAVTGVNGILTVSSRPSSGSTSTVTVPVSGDGNSIDIKATVSGNTAAIKPVKDEELQKVIGDDVEVGTVVIDLNGTNKTITGAKLPTNIVQAIAEAGESGNDTAGLKLELSSGTLEFDAKALETIAAAAADAANIEIHFDEVGTARLNNAQKEAVSEMDVLEGFEAYVTVNGEHVSDFEGGSVTIYIPYEVPEDKDPAAYTVWYVAEDGTLEKMDATYDGENHRFVVSHFSDYVLTYDETVGQYNNCPKDDTCPMSKFTDVDMNAWYHDGVHYCLDNSIMAGFPGDLFKPDGTTTRAQIAQILYNLEGQPAFMNDNIFSDVVSGSWYEKAVVWAQGKGVVSGYPDGTFKPDAPITREQLAVILYNYAKYKGIDVAVDENTNFLSFNDFWDTSEWAKPAMMWAIDRELIVGTNWDLKPQGDAVRAQVATIIWKFCETVAK